jgi:hypothetical protein
MTKGTLSGVSGPIRIALLGAMLALVSVLLFFTASGGTPAQAAGAGSAAFFGENTDTIQVSGQTVIGTTSTYEAVISFPASGTDGRVFNEWTDFQEDKMLQVGPSYIFGFNFPDGAGGIQASNLTLSADAWHHVAYVDDGSQERLYLNGTLVASQANSSGDVGDGGGLAHVGAIFRDGVVRNGFVGYIDSLRISDAARYSGSSFTAPTGDLASDANTLLLYNFDDPAGSTTVADSSGSGRTGTLGAGFGSATSPQLGATAPQDRDTTAPTVGATEPANKATGVRRAAPLTATFSEKMAVGTIGKSTFKLYKITSTGKKQVTNTTVGLSPDGLKATLDPFGASATLLAKNAKYKATVTTGAEDLAGNALDQNPAKAGGQQKTWTFTTGRR